MQHDYHFEEVVDVLDRVEVYDKMVETKTIRQLMCGEPDISCSDFLAGIEACRVFNSYYNGSWLGTAILHLFVGSAHALHHATYPEAWKHHTLLMGQEFLYWLFSLKDEDDNAQFTSLVGLTPKPFRLAVKFAEKNGFRRIGTIKDGAFVNGKVTDLVMTAFDTGDLR